MGTIRIGTNFDPLLHRGGRHRLVESARPRSGRGDTVATTADLLLARTLEPFIKIR